MQDVDILKAFANDRRLMILEWLKQPREHFPPQVDGDLVEDGVCAVLIAEKLGITPAKRIKQWIFYRRNEERVAGLKQGLFASL
jgi:hypothetical protein